MADLVAFLKSGASPAKQFPGNTPALVTASADGSLVLPATKAEICGGDDRVRERVPEHRLLARRAATHVAWTVRVDKPGEFDVYFDYACRGRRPATRSSCPWAAGKRHRRVKATGPRLEPLRAGEGRHAALAAGEHRLDGPPGGAAARRADRPAARRARAAGRDARSGRRGASAAPRARRHRRATPASVAARHPRRARSPPTRARPPSTPTRSSPPS